MANCGPRMALLDARFQFRRTTPGFGHAHATDRITPDEFPQLELVLGGHARSGRVTIGEEIFAVEESRRKADLHTSCSHQRPPMSRACRSKRRQTIRC